MSRIWNTNPHLAIFLVDDLKDIAWNMDLFPRLVLPEGDKELILAACKHKKRSDIDVDFVADKGKNLFRFTTVRPRDEQRFPEPEVLTNTILGRGLILLLFGPPGVGKSFTAEAGKSQADPSSKDFCG